MAYKFLPTNLKDDIINEEINERRKYRMIHNDDGTVSFEDATDYLQKGDLFGGGNVNDINAQINRINQVGWYTRCRTDSMPRAKLYHYSVSDIEYDDRSGVPRTKNQESIDVDEADQTNEWKLDLQPKKYYSLSLNFREYILEMNGYDSDHSAQLIQLTNIGNSVWPYETMLSYKSVAFHGSYLMYLTVYNFSDKVYKNFDLRGFALVYEIKTRLKKVDG